jgi:hypothetical protein
MLTTALLVTMVGVTMLQICFNIVKFSIIMCKHVSFLYAVVIFERYLKQLRSFVFTLYCRLNLLNLANLPLDYAFYLNHCWMPCGIYVAKYIGK